MKAVALLSGGLDSTLAVRLILNQGIDVVAVNFTSPFCLCGKGGCGAVKVAQQLQIPFQIMNLGEAYLEIVRNPKHGYGKNMNPCIDCRIFMFKKALRYAKEIGASFLFTGEVLDERPMSQHRKALSIIEKEAGLEGRLLRPLSASLLPETESERKGWVDREKLLDLSGRSRKRQIKLAHEFGLNGYACPAGGCLLTYKDFAAKVRDLFLHEERIGMKDVNLLKIGRHFRFGKNKLIVGRNEAENAQLAKLKGGDDYLFEVSSCGSPLTLLQGPKTEEAIKTAAALTLRYSDKVGKGRVTYGRDGMDKTVVASVLEASEIEKLRIN
jgi:tRNA U34 2-thiouridine synthase MnmA/TrmU